MFRVTQGLIGASTAAIAPKKGILGGDRNFSQRSTLGAAPGSHPSLGREPAQGGRKPLNEPHSHLFGGLFRSPR